MELLAVSGSLRLGSSNRMLLEAAAARAPPALALRMSAHRAGLPPVNPDLDGTEPPPAVVQWRAAVDDAEGLLLSTPEYAHGLPGAFKNGLDWLVSHPPVLGKPIAIWQVSARGEHAHASLVEILTTMSTVIVLEAAVTLPLLDRPLGRDTLLANPALSGQLGNALVAFGGAIRERAPETERLRAMAAAARPAG